VKRRWWFLALFSPQVVAQPRIVSMVVDKYGNTCHNPSLTSEGNAVCPVPIPRIPKPANNQCPVCGTMAKAYLLPKAEKCYTFVSNMPTSSGWSGIDLPPCPPEWTLVSRPYTQNIACCEHCNNSFWQDAEVKP
jgi:hypothetical protein